MSRSDPSMDPTASTIDRIAAILDTHDLIDVASAVRECCGSTATRRYGEVPATIAAFAVASRRSPGVTIDVDVASEQLGVDPTDVRRSIDLFEAKLSTPAPATERRRLRQSIVAIDELLAAIEIGRSNPPRLAGPGFEAVDPRIRAMAARPLDEVDSTELQRDRRRLAADLTLARLGVELFVRVHAD